MAAFSQRQDTQLTSASMQTWMEESALAAEQLYENGVLPPVNAVRAHTTVNTTSASTAPTWDRPQRPSKFIYVTPEDFQTALLTVIALLDDNQTVCTVVDLTLRELDRARCQLSKLGVEQRHDGIVGVSTRATSRNPIKALRVRARRGTLRRAEASAARALQRQVTVADRLQAAQAELADMEAHAVRQDAFMRDAGLWPTTDDVPGNRGADSLASVTPVGHEPERASVTEVLLTQRPRPARSAAMVGPPKARADLPVCTICLAVVAGTSARALPCAHVFHGRCVGAWLQRKRICPVCKHPVE